MDLRIKNKAKKIKAVFFDIDDTLRIKDTGYMPDSIIMVSLSRTNSTAFAAIRFLIL